MFKLLTQQPQQFAQAKKDYKRKAFTKQEKELGNIFDKSRKCYIPFKDGQNDTRQIQKQKKPLWVRLNLIA